MTVSKPGRHTLAAALLAISSTLAVPAFAQEDSSLDPSGGSSAIASRHGQRPSKKKKTRSARWPATENVELFTWSMWLYDPRLSSTLIAPGVALTSLSQLPLKNPPLAPEGDIRTAKVVVPQDAPRPAPAKQEPEANVTFASAHTGT